MKLETRVVVDATWITGNLSWLTSAMQSPMDEPTKAKFITDARQAFLEGAQAIADQAFQMGVEHARRNP